MRLNNKYATDLTSKDKNLAFAAAKHIIDTADLDAWKCFVENSDNIYDFIKQNIGKYFSDAVNEYNYENLYKLFKFHSFDWDECFIQILLRYSYSNKNLHQKMLNLIENGSEDEKAYAAKYFSFIPEPKANYFLFNAYSVNYEPLKYNAAKALGDSCDMYSYNYFIDKLSSDDDWEKIDAAQFLQWYGNKKAFPVMLEAMNNSAMPEHIAGSVAMLDNISHYFNSDDEQQKTLALDCYQQILDSLAEIWPLSTIIDFEFADCVETIINLINSKQDDSLTPRLCTLLLKTKYQFETFNTEEYKYSEDKLTLSAMDSIIELLEEGDQSFWKYCTSALESELNNQDQNRVMYALEVINCFELSAYVAKIKPLLENSYSENIIYESVMTLAKFNDFSGIDKDSILARVKDFNLKSAIEKILEN